MTDRSIEELQSRARMAERLIRQLAKSLNAQPLRAPDWMLRQRKHDDHGAPGDGRDDEREREGAPAPLRREVPARVQKSGEQNEAELVRRHDDLGAVVLRG